MKDEHQHDIDEIAIRKLILDEWSCERIIRFCAHLMSDKCQKCASKTEEKMENEHKMTKENWMLKNGYSEDDEGFVIVPCECGHPYCSGWKPIAK
jgi:hypothetical protein